MTPGPELGRLAASVQPSHLPCKAVWTILLGRTGRPGRQLLRAEPSRVFPAWPDSQLRSEPGPHHVQQRGPAQAQPTASGQ